MNKNCRLIILLFMVLPILSYGQRLATLQVRTGQAYGNLDLPVSTDLDAITKLPESSIRLVEVLGKARKAVPFQVEKNGRRVLSWIIRPETEPGAVRFFELIVGKPLTLSGHITAVKAGGALTIGIKDKNFLRYNYKTMYPPKGVDTAFKRSGFIHPLWTPHGQELTRINAPDHYHHYGLWNPWTKVSFEGDTIDFWNLKDRKGTVRFVKFISVNQGPVYADYQVQHEHIAFAKDGKEKMVLNELQTVRVFQPEDNQDYYIADIEIKLRNSHDSPVVLKEYRYGGLGWRATEKWNDNNSETLTSEGKTRKDADGTKARWVIVQGSLDTDYGGAVMMSYPANYNHPEPLRIWPEKINGRGDVYANFSPTKDKDWPLYKGQDYILRYRFMVFNGKFNKEKAEAAWQAFASIPTVSVKLIKKNKLTTHR